MTSYTITGFTDLLTFILGENVKHDTCISLQKTTETEEQTESQVAASPDKYIKHPLQNR